MIIIYKVSIIIPTYNYEKFISAAIDSVLLQSHDDIEILVVDDGSTDSTRQIVSNYDSRIKYIYQDNKGPSSARNHGIELATGDFIGFLDADDVFLKNKLEHQLEYFSEHPSCGLTYSDYYCVDKDLRIMESYRSKGFKDRKKALEGLVEKNYINTSTVLMKRKVIEKVGVFNEEYKYLEDLDYWLRIGLEHDFGYVNKFLVKTRSHGYNLRRSTSTRDKLKNGKEILLKYKKIINSL